MKVLNETENKLLKRKEVLLNFESDGATLKRLEIKAQVAKKYKVDEKLIVIENVSSHFGSKSFDVIANVYETEDALKKATRAHIIKRNEAKTVESEEASN